MSQPYTIIIGLETHVQLLTESKLFCGCSTEFGAEPNTQTCPVCIGMPGTLPVMNETAFDLSLKTAVALNCEIAEFTKWDRKQYFYPDSPKGYQISQYDLPFSSNGWLEISDPKDRFPKKRVGIIRAHLEEDAGKSMHDEAHGRGDSRIDLNRVGTPLLEIVSEPDMRSAAEAKAYLTELKLLLTYLGVSDCNMQEGSLRCDANVSVRKVGDTALGTRCEVKNVNSMRFVARAIEYEAKRQVEILEGGGRIDQETRLFDSTKGETRSMRSKEEAHDYRYFPDPDLLPLELADGFVERIAEGLPELPDDKKARFERDHGLSAYDAGVLVAEATTADYFEAVAKGRDAKQAANWVSNDLFGLLGKAGKGIEDSPVPAASLGRLLDLIRSEVISGKIAKDVFAIMFAEGGDPEEIVEARGLKQVTDTDAIEKLVDELIAANPGQVAQALKNPKVAGWFTGQVMKATGGKANPGVVNDLLKKKLAG